MCAVPYRYPKSSSVSPILFLMYKNVKLYNRLFASFLLLYHVRCHESQIQCHSSPECIWMGLKERVDTVRLAPGYSQNIGFYCTPCNPGFYQDLKARRACKPCEILFCAACLNKDGMQTMPCGRRKHYQKWICCVGL